MTIIDADILKHSAMVQFFRDNFSKFFQKQCRKGEKHRSNHLKMFWEQGVAETSKKKEKEKKISNPRQKSRQFLEKYI